MMKRFAAYLTMWLLCVLVFVWATVAYVLSAVLGKGHRALAIAQSTDQLGNVCGGGDQDEWFSARCWRLQYTSPKWKRLVRLVDWVFLTLTGEAHHCQGAYEAELKRRRRDYGVQPKA